MNGRMALWNATACYQSYRTRSSSPVEPPLKMKFHQNLGLSEKNCKESLPDRAPKRAFSSADEAHGEVGVKHSGETQPKCSLSWPTPPSVLRVIQNPFGKVIFVKKAPWNQSRQRENNPNGQITVLSIFRLFYFFQRTNFAQRTFFFKMFFDRIQGKNLI